MKEKREGDDTGGRRERMKGEASGGNEGEKGLMVFLFALLVLNKLYWCPVNHKCTKTFLRNKAI